jgi:hypothetical protein
VSLTLIPDIEKLVSDYVRDHADIIALSTRVVGRTPVDKYQSWIHIAQLDAPQVNSPDHLVEFMVQFDCYAGVDGGQPEAISLARTVRAILGTLAGSHSAGTVTGVRVLGGPRTLDTKIEPARDREIVTAIIWAHA